MRVNLNLNPVNRNFSKIQKSPAFGSVNKEWAKKIINNPNTIDELFGEVLIAEDYRQKKGKGKVLPNQVSVYDAFDTLAIAADYVGEKDHDDFIAAMAILIEAYGIDSLNQQIN